MLSPRIHTLKPYPLVVWLMSQLRLTGVIRNPKSLGMVLRRRGRDAGCSHSEEVPGEDTVRQCQLQSRKRGLPGNQHHWYLDLRLPASGMVRKYMLMFKWYFAMAGQADSFRSCCGSEVSNLGMV